jgi:hypothetical protein
MRTLLAEVFILLALPMVVSAQMPYTMGYQTVLIDAEGNPDLFY